MLAHFIKQKYSLLPWNPSTYCIKRTCVILLNAVNKAGGLDQWASTEWDANIGFTVNPANGEDFERCERKNDKTSSKEIDQAEHVLAALHSTSVK